MSNQRVKTKSEEYGEKCDIFEDTLDENQQKKFYNLETLIHSLSAEQKKMFFELMNISNQIYNS